MIESELEKLQVQQSTQINYKNIRKKIMKKYNFLVKRFNFVELVAAKNLESQRLETMAHRLFLVSFHL